MCCWGLTYLGPQHSYVASLPYLWPWEKPTYSGIGFSWIVTGNPVSDGMMGIEGAMARSHFLCPVTLKISRLFGISQLTTPLVPLQSQRGIQIPQDDDWGTNLECQLV